MVTITHTSRHFRSSEHTGEMLRYSKGAGKSLRFLPSQVPTISPEMLVSQTGDARLSPAFPSEAWRVGWGR